MEDGIGEGLINWFKTFTHLYVDLIEPRMKTDSKGSITSEDYIETEKALREQRLNTIYTVKFYIDSFFSIASAIIELQKFTRYLRVFIFRKKIEKCDHYFVLFKIFCLSYDFREYLSM